VFGEPSCVEYFESVSELRRRGYEEAVARAEEQLESVLFLSEGSINMLDVADVYKHEDEVYFAKVFIFLYFLFSLFCTMSYKNNPFHYLSYLCHKYCFTR